ncbi:MAG: arsenosugar biosynthesis radical SAM protein ArsS [Eggerthellaceae bacterium]|nr:arsenosugar biosynthesis radical SAM protein ArsS [Eggerthellaceae bacterium]
MDEASLQGALDCVPPFESLVPLEHRTTNAPLTTLQINVGYRCNLACRHCHLECGPNREEAMSKEVMQACLDAYDKGGFSSVDITGGAPEMHPELEWFLREWKKRGVSPIVRTNLCILTEPNYQHFVQLYDEVGAQLFASLPFYEAGNVDKIRGAGTFEASLEGLRALNDVGYGDHDGQGDTHTITLVFNPATATFPPSQAALEGEYRRKLTDAHGVHFSNLVAITNNPSGRFAEALHRKDNLAGYMKRLHDAFNPATTEGMMCRSQISVDWKGKVYDCDFNQALGLEIEGGASIFDFARERQPARKVVFANHCYGCTAGAGSSCGGETA